MSEGWVIKFEDITYLGTLCYSAWFFISLRASSDDPVSRFCSWMGFMMVSMAIILWILKKEQII